MSSLAGLHLALGVLLVAAGLPKLRDPAPLVRALASAGLPASRPLVRLLASVEVAVGVAVVIAPGRVTALALAGAYACFTGFVALALRRGGVLSSCGCFGRSDTPPTVTHLVVTAAATVVGLLGAVSPPVDPWLDQPPGTMLILGAYAVLVAFLATLVIAVLPTVTAPAVTAAQRPGG